jgi:ribosomal protein S18 acetylase RimI-like enzyme
MPIMTDCETAVSVLVAAFADDPVLRWLVPHPGGGSEADLLFRPLVQASATQGELAVSVDGTAVAVWLRVGAHPDGVEGSPVPERLRVFLTLTEERHPKGREHLYLPFLGVLPGAQGRGRGGALLRDRLARADVDRVPAYVEASSPRNRPLYERHGFCDTGAPITLPDGPPLWPMWREPHR